MSEGGFTHVPSLLCSKIVYETFQSINYLLFSYRGSRISFSITQNQQEMRRSSVASLKSSIQSPMMSRKASVIGPNALAAAISAQQRGSRQGELWRKLSRLAVTDNDNSKTLKKPPSSRKMSLVSQGSLK